MQILENTMLPTILNLAKVISLLKFRDNAVSFLFKT